MRIDLTPVVARAVLPAAIVTLFLILCGSPVWAQSLVDGSSAAPASAQSPDALVARGNSVIWLDGMFIGTGDGATLVPLGIAVDQLSFGDRFLSYADANNNGPITTKATQWAPVQMPAVDGINGKIDAYGGGTTNLNTAGVYGTDGSLSLPIGRQFGAQFDGGVGSLDNSGLYNAALHLFWRDPSIGLLGAYSSGSHFGLGGFGATVEHNAAEGEYYAGRWTFGGIAGVETAQTSSPVGAAAFSIPTRGFDAVSASYYVTDNFKLSVGHMYILGRNALTLESEYGFALGGGRMGALFADALIGESGTYAALGGVRFYFGEHDKTLIERNRQDDPAAIANPLYALLNGLRDAQAIEELRNAGAIPPLPKPNSSCPAGTSLHYAPNLGYYCS